MSLFDMHVKTMRARDMQAMHAIRMRNRYAYMHIDLDFGATRAHTYTPTRTLQMLVPNQR